YRENANHLKISFKILINLKRLARALSHIGANLAAGATLPPNQHRRAKIVYASAGVMTVRRLGLLLLFLPNEVFGCLVMLLTRLMLVATLHCKLLVFKHS
ncbi:MAG: hypothetical protein ACI8W1_002319, partial [Candidatus Azotimanducaceae bacterium]